MSSNDYIAPILAKLTSNGAMNLYFSVKMPPQRDDPDQCGRLWTGSGKYTVLAARGVSSHLKKLGLAEERMVGQRNKWDKGYPVLYWTALGKEVARYLHDHWDELNITFREGTKQ